MILNDNRQSVLKKAKLIHGMADPSRLMILEALRTGCLHVAEITAVTGLSQPNASNHLACLRECGLVTARPNGRQVFYQLRDERVARLLGLADELLEESI